MGKAKEEELEWEAADDEEEVVGDMGIWNPAIDGKEGDELVGEVVEINEGVYGIEAKIKQSIDGEVRTTPAHRILQGALAKFAVGDLVRITYTGAYKTQTGMIAKSYRVGRRK